MLTLLLLLFPTLYPPFLEEKGTYANSMDGWMMGVANIYLGKNWFFW